MSTVIPEELAGTIVEYLSKWSDDVEDALKKTYEQVGKESVDRLKRTAPNRTGQYGSGWTKRKQGEGQVVYNRKRPGLTHLLEHGHLTRSGRRTVPGQKHIEPVDDFIADELVKALEKALS